MRGISATALIAIALALSACAPMEPRPAPDEREPSAPEPAGDTSGSEPTRPTRPEQPEQRPAPEPEAAKPDESTDQEPEVAPPAETSGKGDESLAPAPANPPEQREPEPEPRTTEDQAPAQPDPAPGEETAQARAAAAAPQRNDLDGRIRLVGGDADVDEAMVYFVSSSHGNPAAEAPTPDPAEIVTRDKELSPTVLTVSSGTEVRFPNDDPILHNLFSVSSSNEFDLGVYGPGESPSVRFEQPGAVNIYCNVHHDMHAHVLVVDTPWYTSADSDGRFSLTGLPAGEGELRIWHRQSEAWSRPIRLPVDEPIEVTLEVSKPRLPPHRDKTGQPYNRRDRDPYR